MKSKHRHELKTNELAEWIANFPQWAQENARMIIFVAVVAVWVIGSACFYWYQKNVVSVRKQLELTRILNQLSQSKMQIIRAQAQGIDASYILLQPANNLKIFAQNAKNNQTAAFALIKQAEALRTELHYRFGTVAKRDFTAQINRAKDSYTEAIDKYSPNPSLMAAAKFGLGLCEEDLGNFDQAKQMYQDITENPDFEGTAAAAQAKRRLDTIADYQKKIVFKEAPKPTLSELTQPQIKLKAPEASGPNSQSIANETGTPNAKKASGNPDTNLPTRQNGKTVKR